MEVDEEPRDSTDPVGDASPAQGNPDPETKAGTTFPAGENTPPNPNGTGCPIIVLPEDGSGPDGESKETCSQCDQVGDTGAEEESVPVGDIVDPREMDTAPATTPPSPVALAEAEEKIPIAEYHAPTPEGYVTPTGVLSATGSPTRPRASPKRKQLSSLEESELAAGLACAVKRHCGSTPELVPSSRLPGHMPYGLSPCLEKEEPEKVEKGKSQSSTSEGDESLWTPPTTPVHAARSLNVSQEEEPEDPVFATPPEENRAPEMPRNSPTTGTRDADRNFQGPLDKLAASPKNPAIVRSPAETALSSPAGPEASGRPVSLFTGSEEESLALGQLYPARGPLAPPWRGKTT